MKKIMKVVIATVLSIGLFACSSEPKEVKVVKSFLDNMQQGNFNGCINNLSEDMQEVFNATYAYEEFKETTEMEEATTQAIDELVSTVLKVSCKNYTISESVKESDDKYKVTAKIDYIDLENLDVSEVQDELLEQYEISEEMLEELDDVGTANLVIRNIAKYTNELMQYGIKNGETISVDTTFTVENINGEWKITDIN